jgi:hypothetical protein
MEKKLNSTTVHTGKSHSCNFLKLNLWQRERNLNPDDVFTRKELQLGKQARSGNRVEINVFLLMKCSFAPKNARILITGCLFVKLTVNFFAIHF